MSHKLSVHIISIRSSQVELYVLLQGLEVLPKQLLQALQEVLVVGALGAVQPQEEVCQVFLSYASPTLRENLVEQSWRNTRSSSVVSSHSSPSSQNSNIALMQHVLPCWFSRSARPPLGCWASSVSLNFSSPTFRPFSAYSLNSNSSSFMSSSSSPSSLPPISFLRHLMRVARILRGAFTSLLTLVCEGLNPMTRRLSMRLSLSRKSLESAMNLYFKESYVDILVKLPLNRLCCRSHLSTRIFSPILFSIENEARKSMMFRTLPYHSPFAKGLAGSVFSLIRQEYMSTSDWITLGVLDLKTFKTTSCRTSWSGFSKIRSKLRIERFPTQMEAPSKDLSAGILSRE